MNELPTGTPYSEERNQAIAEEFFRDGCVLVPLSLCPSELPGGVLNSCRVLFSCGSPSMVEVRVRNVCASVMVGSCGSGKRTWGIRGYAL